MSKASEQSSAVPPELRSQFAEAINSGEVSSLTTLLEQHPNLANADLRSDADRDHFTNGLPLFRACSEQRTEIAELLLESGAHPDAPGNNPDDQPEFGMPLHFAICDRNFGLANLLLDHGASANSYPNCDQSTMERLYYMASADGLSESLLRRSFAKYLPEGDALQSKPAAELTGDNASESIEVFARMVDAGGQVPFSALVRDGRHDLAIEIARHAPDQDGTPHDHPNSTVFNNIFGAARWHGYPELIRRLMEAYPDRIDYQGALDTITTAIGSHNRDGDYAAYREIIVMQLERLKELGALEQARADKNFHPHFQIAKNFCWHENYGYKAEISEPLCYVDLAELLKEWGFGDIDRVDDASGQAPISRATQRGHHPGIVAYVQWLIASGADLRQQAPNESNPYAIASENGHAQILKVLIAAR